MSLFTLKDVWNVECGGERSGNFSYKSVCIGNIENEGNDKIVVGSYSGVLRLFGTTEVKGSTASADPIANEEGQFSKTVKPVLLAELDLNSPILQVETGYFVGGSNKIHLAILHPNKLGIYRVTKVQGQVEHGSQYKVTLLYEHQLKRLAFNMCVGQFGGGGSKSGAIVGQSKRRDLMCVQSLDGTLSFYEQEVFSFSRYLPNFLIPGPLSYNPSTNSFLTLNSSWELESFRYSSLAMAKDETASQRQMEETSVGKRLTPDWSVSIGEEPIGDVQVLSSANGDSRIVLLTCRNLFSLSGVGEIVACKRLD